MIKEFNWDTATGSKEKIEWLKTNCNNFMREDEFVLHWKELKRFSNTIGRKLHKNYSPSTARSNYRDLVKDFGFFVA